MAAAQKKWLTASKGKLSKADLPAVLRQEQAWELLPRETRQELYDLLPRPQPGEAPYDIDVNPLHTSIGQYIETELRRWQDDLRDGKETKAWRDAAMEAGRDRREGKFDEWKEAQREAEWGRKDENVAPANDMDVQMLDADDENDGEDELASK